MLRRRRTHHIADEDLDDTEDLSTDPEVIRENRRLETFGFKAGVYLAAFNVVAETALRLGVCFSPGGGCAPDQHVPWFLLALTVILIAPKMLGRARAGRIIEGATGGAISALTLRLTGRGPARVDVTSQTPDGHPQMVASAKLPAGNPPGSTSEVTVPVGHQDAAAVTVAPAAPSGPYPEPDAPGPLLDDDTARAGKATPEAI
jgi:hypothetical protein